MGNMMSFSWWDNSSLENQLIEAAIQVVVWFVILTSFGMWLQKKCDGQDWYENRVAKQPGGKDEFIVFLRVLPQHLLSAIMLWYAINFNNSNVFRSALLAEFGYECIDLTRVWYLFFTGEMKGPGGKVVFTYMTLHHLPGILSIIPANMCCSEDPLFQEIPWCLLSLPWLNIVLMTLCKCADLNNINERAQFMVWYSISTLIFGYCRFIWLPTTFYHYIMERIIPMEGQYAIKGILIFYGVFITAFNVYLMWIMVDREYILMYGAKNDDHRKKIAVKLQHQMSLRGGLGNAVFDDMFSAKAPKVYPKYVKSKFKRHHTTPNIFDGELHSNKSK